MGALMAPIIILLVAVVMLFSSVGSSFSNLANGGTVNYNEKTFQDYANQQYAAEFGSSSAYEDNILLIFLTDEESTGYYAIGWVGDNIHSDINKLFGAEGTALWRITNSTINQEYYAYSLGSNLASVAEKMTDEVTRLNLDSPFRQKSDHSSMTPSHITNHTGLQISKETVDAALQQFTAETDIPMVIVVDSMEKVLGKTLAIGDIMVIVITVGLAVLAIWLIVRAVRNRPKKGDYDNHNTSSKTKSGYDNSRWEV